MKKLKIAQVASLWETIPPRGYGGTEMLTESTTNELVKRGHNVTLFATGNSKTRAKLKSVIPQSLFEKKFDWYHRAWNIINASNAVANAGEFDIIHNYAGDSAIFFSNISKTPMLTTLCNVLPSPDQFKSDEYITYNYYAKKTNFVSISFNQRTHTDIKFNYAGTIYCGIDIKKFTFNLKPENYLAWLGRIHHGKGLVEAVDVANKSKNELVIAGNMTCKSDEDYYKEIEAKIDGRKIKYIGEVGPKKKNELLGNAKALLFPIRWEEAFGFVMIEAMACGTPVIAFKRGSVCEVVKNGKTGFIVESEEEMIEAVKNIDKIDRAECRKHVVKYFTIEKMVDGYEKIYEKIIKNK